MKVIIDKAERLWKIPQPSLGPMRFITKRLGSRGVDVIDLESFHPELPDLKSLIAESESLVSRPGDPPANPALILELKTRILEKHQSLRSAMLDPEKELAIIPGVRMAAALVALAVLNPGDSAAYPDPGAPYIRSAICLADGIPRRYLLLESNDYVANISSLAQMPLKKMKMLFVNYPHNPTSGVVDLYFYLDLLRSMKSANVLIIADCAHVHPGDPEAATPLQVKNARTRILELHSFSTTLGIAGLGFAAGHRDIISSLTVLLGRLGFSPRDQDVRLASVLLDNAPWVFADKMQTLQRRREILIDGLKKLGWRVRSSRTVPFVWARHPAKSTSVAFARRLFAKAGVRVAPGTDFGEAGEGWLRLTLGPGEQSLREAVERLSAHSKIWQRKYRPHQ